MRLTLRTLLAYLDDTLDPSQTRAIGLKVAESDVARELVDRIRKVTRKRSLTVPPADKADANIVAEYLDNDLPPEKVTEVEEQALHSEVHLAEIASCHQLLTLILSEPAKVPPSALQRMYSVVKGPEVDTTRQAPKFKAATLAPESPLMEDDEASPLVSRRGGKKRLIAAAILSLGLIVAVIMVLRSKDLSMLAKLPRLPANEIKSPVPAAKESTKAEKKESIVPAEPKTTPPLPDQSKESTPPPEQLKTDQPKADKATAEPQKPVDAVVSELAMARKTSDERKEVGKPVGGSGLLVQSVHDGAEWQRVAGDSALTGVSRLLSLPGITNSVVLGNSVIVEIVGQVPELNPQEFPEFEAVVQTFVPASGIDADLRLERGRAYLRAAKPTGGKARLRMGNDVLDVTFADDQSEIIADVNGAIGVVRGKVQVRPNLRPEISMKAAPGLALLLWQPGAGWADKPVELEQAVPAWNKSRNVNGPGREAAQEMEALVKRLPKLLGDTKKDFKLSVSELAYERSPYGRRLALYCQGAMDDLPPLIDALEDQANHESRIGAVMALSHWLLRGADHSNKLQEGLMTRKGMTPAQANRAIALFHGFDEPALRDPLTYARLIEGLADERLALRELSYWRLSQLDPDGARAIRYVPTDTSDALQRAKQEWKRRIPDGAVPTRSRA